MEKDNVNNEFAQDKLVIKPRPFLHRIQKAEGFKEFKRL